MPRTFILGASVNMRLLGNTLDSVPFPAPSSCCLGKFPDNFDTMLEELHACIYV